MTYWKIIAPREAFSTLQIISFQAVTVADVNEEVGKQSLDALSTEFGPNKALFVKADVTDKNQFEGLQPLNEKCFF